MAKKKKKTKSMEIATFKDKSLYERDMIFIR
jgi:hypothetical protein